MTQAMQIVSSLLGSSCSSSSVVQRNKTSCCGSSLTRKPHSLTICQLDRDKFDASAAELSRRNFMTVTTVSLTSATAAGFIIQPDSAQAAKRKPPPPTEEKRPEDDKNLSAYDAKLLANQRRKEALKELLEKQKLKAKSIAGVAASAPTDIFGQGSNDNEE